MAKITRFEELDVWKNSMKLTSSIYQFFSNCKDFGLRDQIQRAAVSVPSNIAEGFERQTNKEFIHFLYIARGSCGEVRTQLYIAKDLSYISDPVFEELSNLAVYTSRMLSNLIQYRKSL